MKVLIILTIFPLLLISQTVSDSVEYNHIYITDSSTIVKTYKEAKDYPNPFGIINYFSITIFQNTFFRLSLYNIKELKFEKTIFQSYLKPGNYRITDSEIGTKYRGFYYYGVDVYDSVHYEKVLILE